MPDLTHVFNGLTHRLEIMKSGKETKFMRCVKLFTLGDELHIIFKNQVIEAECTNKTMLYKNCFYKLENFVEASPFDMVKYYNKQRRKQ